MSETINQNIRKLFYRHFTPETNVTLPESVIKPFIEELGALVQKIIAASTKRNYSQEALMPIRDLEEFVRVFREFRDFLENKVPHHTPSDIIMLDELKQLEFKLTEKILTNR